MKIGPKDERIILVSQTMRKLFLETLDINMLMVEGAKGNDPEHLVKTRPLI